MLESELKAFLKGNKELFEDKKALEALPGHIDRWFEKEELGSVDLAISRLGEGLLSEYAAVQQDIVRAVSRVGERLLTRREMGLLYQLSRRVMVWIILETHLTPPYERICRQLGQLAIHLILEGRFGESDHILETFYIIRTGKLKKSREIQDRAASLLDGVATDEVLDVLLDEFQTDDRGKRSSAIDCLLHLGTASAGPLLGLLRWSPSRYERARILQILSFIGRQAVPALTREIGKDQPWFYVRNVVQLLGKMGDARHMTLLEPLLAHKDLRVQREALHAIHQVGGARSEAIALSILHGADDRLKPDIVQVLGAVGSKKAIPELLEILQSGSAHPAEDLGAAICDALGAIGAQEAVPVLNRLLEEAGADKETMRSAAAGALARIQEKTGRAKAIRLTPKQEHVKRWPELYGMLTPKEGDAFFASLVEMVHEEEELILKQGEMNRCLFFIEEGEVVFAYDQDDEEIWVKTLRAGEVAGGESFFSASVSTTSLRAVTAVRLHVLEKEDLIRRCKRFPGLEEKLRTYCFRTGQVRTILKQYGMERRIDRRAEITARVSIQFLSKDDRPERKTIRGDLLDISAGGLSTLVAVSAEEACRFVGRRINVKLVLEVGDPPLEIDQNGVIVAVFPKNNDASASVHVKFDWRLTRLLDLDAFIRIKGVAADFEENGPSEKKDDFLITRLPE
jgi:HEAT repeat protein